MSSLIPYRDVDPLREMERMLETMRNFVRMGPAGNWYTQPGFTQLAINLSEKDNMLVVETAMPGVSEEDININVADDILTITADRQEKAERQDEQWHVREFQYGRVARSIRLPHAVNAGAAEAELQNGILTIRIPIDHPVRNRIEIKPRKMIEGKSE
ncbi:MAG TPA: Hsp20/alpha crystallin family protein [Aggregatilineales bacterium]|nr:Hsp20/alpha crystallin family protein [Aggregatilineales bacterium]